MAEEEKSGELGKDKNELEIMKVLINYYINAYLYAPIVTVSLFY